MLGGVLGLGPTGLAPASCDAGPILVLHRLLHGPEIVIPAGASRSAPNLILVLGRRPEVWPEKPGGRLEVRSDNGVLEGQHGAGQDGSPRGCRTAEGKTQEQVSKAQQKDLQRRYAVKELTEKLGAVFPVFGVTKSGACHCKEGAACPNIGKHPIWWAGPPRAHRGHPRPGGHLGVVESHAAVRHEHRAGREPGLVGPRHRP